MHVLTLKKSELADPNIKEKGRKNDVMGRKSFNGSASKQIAVTNPASM